MERGVGLGFRILLVGRELGYLCGTYWLMGMWSEQGAFDAE